MQQDPDVAAAEIARLRRQRQQLEEELERHVGVRNAWRQLWHQVRASLLAYARQFYHQYFPHVGRRVRAMRRAQNPDFQPYQIKLPTPLPGALRPRILHAIPDLAVGGSQQLLVDLMETTGHILDYHIITRHTWGMPAYVGVPTQPVPYVRSVAAMMRVLTAAAPTLVHVHYWGNRAAAAEHWRWYYYVFEAAARLGLPLVENCNDPTGPYLHPHVARYVFVSQYALTHFGDPVGRNVVIYPGSNFQLFTRPATELPPPGTIGMVYRLDADKLDAASIDVFIEVVRRRPRTRALIVGSGTFDALYRQKVAAAGLGGAIEFTGMVTYQALPAYYRQLSLFVAPVYRESFGQVTPFAMHMRLPVAGYDVGALGEILAQPEVLAAPGNVQQLADIIIALLDDPARCQALGAHNQRRAQALFSLETMVADYTALYAEVLGSLG
ncbi:glycosyltransferase family 4 protein [Hymenobacter sp. RP-2-7]|uniref:Glycosyltransferase family 4 protein n=1 Tax=Hymenobacter polaris TaxID=2682546 RepID=A0A7Y0ABD7_9BACT|nr:glycosyltransferase family 4 protein [Hymenobacter polaris]NML64240.1 glycosyltransferase family 4 protein [Hymenobacter polaris]